MTPRVERAINVLLDSLNNETLAKGSVCGCAIGNLINASFNSKIEKEVDHFGGTYLKSNIIDDAGMEANWYDHIRKDDFRVDASDIFKEQTKNLEFTEKEIIAIERAFESNTVIPGYSVGKGHHTKEEIRADQIKGLEAVVKVMLSFDESKDDVKEVFTNKADLIPV